MTERLRLVPSVMDPSPIHRNVQWLNDPKVVRYSEQRHRQHTYESQFHYVGNGPSIFREIHADDAFIGTITATIDRNNDVADVGIMIGEKSVWGNGYGYEAWAGFCDYLFENGVRKIEAGAMSENRPMIGIFRKYKMEYEGRRSEHFLLGEELVDMVLWGKFRD